MPSGKPRGIKSEMLKEASIQKALGEECQQKEAWEKGKDITPTKKEGKVKEKYMMFHSKRM